jgi:hypothetical protein
MVFNNICQNTLIFFSSSVIKTNIVRIIKSRRIRLARHVARTEEGRGVYRVLVGRPERKRPLRRPRPRWEDNIKTDLREMGIDGGELDSAGSG